MTGTELSQQGSSKSGSSNAAPLSESSFAESGRQLVALGNRLRQAGAQFHLDIPTVMVCGDQSAGKSSVIQRICGVNLPRSDGTCTRCPMEIRLSTTTHASNSDHKPIWSCTIKIRIEYNEQDVRLSKGDEFVFGKTDNPDEVEALIRGAQMAVLHPNTKASYFLPEHKGAPVKEEQLLFSRNLVIVEIKGAAVDLTLIDLPGIIRSADSEDAKHCVPLTRNLTKDYMANPKTIIVLVISCKVDIDNQEVYALAKEADPRSDRTIGVLTKPDQIEEGCDESWRLMMLGGVGARFPLRLGWRMVRNPTKMEMDKGCSVDEATEFETRFFSSKQPWADLQQGHGAQFGIKQLMATMSKELVRLTKEAVPEMQLKVAELKKKALSQLKSLPKAVPADEQKAWVTREIRSLATELHNKAEAKHREKTFYHSVHALFAAFTAEVIATRPVFKIAENNGVPVYAKYGQTAPEGSPPLPGDPLDTLLETMLPDIVDGILDTDDVRGIIADETGKELPDSIPYPAVVRVISDFQDRWTDATNTCLESVAEVTRDEAVGLVTSRFAQFPSLEFHMIESLEQCLGACQTNTAERLRELLKMESTVPFTLNTEGFLSTKTQILDGLCNDSLLPTTTALYASVKNNLRALGIPNATSAQISRLGNTTLGKEDTVLKTMASAMAYFKISSTRFKDMVPMTVMLHLLDKFCNGIEDHLVASMGPSSSSEHDVLSNLLQEDPQIAKERKDLIDKLANLEGASKVLRHYKDGRESTKVHAS